MGVCGRCQGLGYIERDVVILGPVRPFRGRVYWVRGYQLDHVPAGMSGSARVMNRCRRCQPIDDKI